MSIHVDSINPAIWFVVAFWAGTFVVNSSFAFAVDRDARRLGQEGRDTVLVATFVWSLATFLGGPIVAVGYWIVHRAGLAVTTSQAPTGHNGRPSAQTDPL